MAQQAYIDNIGAHSGSILEGTIKGKPVVRSVMGGDKCIALQISIWLPEALKVDSFPEPLLIQFGWYASRDERCIGIFERPVDGLNVLPKKWLMTKNFTSTGTP